MAWENITYKCGHTGRKQIHGKCSTRTDRAEWFGRENLCPECEEKRLAEWNAANAAKNADAGLPALKGSDKQIAWAESIRAMAMDSYKDFEELFNPDPTPEAAETLATIRQIWQDVLAEARASWWIDNRDQTARQIITDIYRQRKAS